MAKPKQYRVVDKLGVVGFKGVIHASGDIIDGSQVPAANLNAWIRFGQVEEVQEKSETQTDEPKSEKKGKKS
jgi:hypothetical protein